MGKVHSKVYDRCYSNFKNVYYLAKLTVIIWAYCVHLYLDTSLKSKFLIWWTVITSSEAHPSQMLNYWASTAVMFYLINNSLYQRKSYGWPKVHVSCLQIFPQFHWKQWPEHRGQWEGQRFPLDHYDAVPTILFLAICF